jgi:hypothetical protein
MSRSIFALVLSISFVALASLTAFAMPAKLTGLETAVFADREVVVIRHSGDVSASPRYLYDLEKGTLTITLTNLDVPDTRIIDAKQKMLQSVKLEQVKGANQARLTLVIKDRAVIDRQLFRYGDYTQSLLLVELFPSGEDPKNEPAVADLEGMLKKSPEDRAKSPLVGRLEPKQMLTVNGKPNQAIGLMEKSSLINLDTKLTIVSDQAGTVSSDQGSRGIKAALDENAVSEVVFIGPKGKIQEARSFLASTRLSQTARTLGASTEQSMPPGGNGGSDSEYPIMTPGTQRDPFDMRQNLKNQLSDILVNLPATGGYNFYGVINLLSQMSGISIIIDPYLVDPPTGSRRPNLLEEPGGGGGDGQGGPGFRDAGGFQAINLRGATNTVIGNFENVPFDTALQIILEAHNLEYIVFSTPETEYTKPVILISSRERIEQEIFGANEIDLYQAHYADPQQLYSILDNMGLLPSRERGWSVYQNPGGQGGRGGNNNRNGGGGSGGSGGGGNGGSGGGGQTGPGGGFSVMGVPVDPTQQQALMLEFSPSSRDERISELLALAANKGLDLLTVNFSSADKAKQGRMLVIVLGA